MTEAAASLADLPALATARLRLAPLRLEDAEALRAITDDPEITDNIHFLARPFRREDAAALIGGKGDGHDCFIGLWRGADLVGVFGAHLAGTDRIEIGYWIARAWHGQGLATEAAAAAISMLRRRIPDRHVFAECRPDNRASWRVLEKLGFSAAGIPGARPGRQVLTLG